ncbi:hypothetical protein [Pedobacter aquatilis]|uniref:hypothetical protein n=1 Tax=Pedobacter aquatilis TaxID=351343 RepID=UPI00292D31FD|nr:hypothetical protein [Pedobacter aquatilis]
MLLAVTAAEKLFLNSRLSPGLIKLPVKRKKVDKTEAELIAIRFACKNRSGQINEIESLPKKTHLFKKERFLKLM